MTPEERVAILERLDAIIRERNTWHDLRALDAYETLWEMTYGQARLAVQVAAAARKVVEQDELNEGSWEPAAEQPEPATGGVVDPAGFPEPEPGCTLTIPPRPSDSAAAKLRSLWAQPHGGSCTCRECTARDEQSAPARIHVRHDPAALMEEPDLYADEKPEPRTLHNARIESYGPTTAPLPNAEIVSVERPEGSDRGQG